MMDHKSLIDSEHSVVEAGVHESKDNSGQTILYLHIPKSGGSTLSNYIFNQAHCHKFYVDEKGWLVSGIYYFPGKKEIKQFGFFKDKDLAIPENVKHVLSRDDIRAVLGHFWFGIHQYLDRPWTYVTVLRHPVERILSLYSFIKKWEIKEFVSMNIDQFIKQAPCREVDNDQTRRISGLEPEVGKCSRLMLEIAKDNLRKYFSIVGVTERFNETLILLKRTFGWSKDILYYPKLVNKNRPSASSLPKQTIDAIRERNELDMELYEFANYLLDEAISLQGSSFHDELQTFESSLKSKSWYKNEIQKKS